MDHREGARVQIQVGRDDVKATLEQQLRLRQEISANRFPVPETAIEKAAQGYAAALDRLEALNDSGASGIELRRAQMEVNLARTVFDETRNPRRVASDPPPWLVGVDTFVKEFGKGALAVVTLGGTGAIERAYDSGRLNAKSSPADAVHIYLEGVFNGITFGFGDAFVESYAGQGRDGLSSGLTAFGSSLRNISGYDDLRTIFFDPHATPYDKAQAVATLVAKWAGLAAAGVAGTRYANIEVPNPFARARLPGLGTRGPAGVGVPGTLPPRSVWSEPALKRGQIVEQDLARTEYKDWYHVGAERGGTFELVDFQKGRNLVSLKTVDTTTQGWMSGMKAHVRDLGTRGSTVASRRQCGLIFAFRRAARRRRLPSSSMAEPMASP